MPFVLRSENDTENPPLAVPYGKQITAGKLAYYIKEGARNKCIIFLGEGEMDGIDRLIYKGADIPEFSGSSRNWKFHAGTITTQPIFKTVNSFNTTNSEINVTGNNYVVGDPIAFVGDLSAVLPTTLAQHTKYFVVYSSGNIIKVSATLGGTAIIFPADKTGNVRIYKADAGYFDPLQGRPEFFPTLKFTFSGICYVEVFLDSVMSEMEDEPVSFKIFVRGKRVQNFTSNGSYADSAGVAFPDQVNLPIQSKFFSANNALIAVDIMLNYMKLPKSRIDWESFVAYRAFCDALIDWNSGTTPVLANPTWTHTNTSESPLGTIRKISGGTAWNAAAGTVQTIALSDYDKISMSAIYRTKDFMFGVSKTVTPISYADNLYGIHVSSGANRYQVYKGSTIIHQGAIGNYTVGDVYKITTTATNVNFYRNGTLFFTTTNDLNDGNPNPLRGMVAINKVGDYLEDIRISPMIGVNRKTNRFDCHIVFPQQMAGILALEQVFGRSPGCHWQDVGGKIKFIVNSAYKTLSDPTVVPGDRVLAGSFVYDPNQFIVKSNIVENSFSSYRKPSEEKSNFLRLELRDLDDPYYTKKYSYSDRPNLKDQVGTIVDPGIIPIGVATQSLADRIGEATLRYGSDLDLFVQMQGQANTFHIAKGDIVTLAHDVPEWGIDSSPLFIVTEESFESSADTADERSFVLQIYNPEFYSDTAHGAITGSFPTATTSQLTPPPVLSSWSLIEIGRTAGNGTYIPTIYGEVTFDSTYSYRQRVRIYWEKPGGTFVDTGLVLTQPNQSVTTMNFELVGAPTGLNRVKFITETLAGIPSVSNSIGNITIVGTSSQIPDPPTNLRAQLGEGTIIWNWTIPTVNSIISHYEVRNQNNQVIRIEPGNSWAEPIILGVNSVTRTVYSVSHSGVASSTGASLTFNMSAVPSSPSNYTLSYDGNVISHRWGSNSANVTWQGITGATLGSDNSITSTTTGWAGGAYSAEKLNGNGYADFLVNAGEEVIVGLAEGTNSGSSYVDVDFGIVIRTTGNLEPFYKGSQLNSSIATGHTTGDIIRVSVENLTVKAYRIRAGVSTLLYTWSQVPVLPLRIDISFGSIGTVRGARLFGATVSDIEFEISTNNTFTDIKWRGRDNYWMELPTIASGSVTRYIRAINNVLGLTSSSTSATLNLDAPNPVTGATGTYDGSQLIWRWTASTSQGVLYYEIYDNPIGSGGVLLATVTGTEWRETPVAGTSNYTRYIYAVIRNGSNQIVRSTVTSVAYTISAPSAPSNYTTVLDGSKLLHRWTSNQNVRYEIWSLNSSLVPQALLWAGQGSAYDESSFSTTSRTLYRGIRAINSAGLFSGYSNLTINNPAPTAPTVTRDTVRTTPSSMVIHITPTVPTNKIKWTVVQMRALPSGTYPANTNQGNNNQIRVAGAPEEISVDWTPGGQMELKVSHEDVFTDTLHDNIWSSPLSYTFPSWGSGTIGTLGDVNFDTTSALARLIASRSQIPISGGGDMRWSSGRIEGEYASWINNTNGTISGNSWTSTGSITTSGINSNINISGDFVLSFEGLGATWAIGLDTVNTVSTYTTIDFGIYRANNVLNVIENNTIYPIANVIPNNVDTYEIRRVGTVITYYRNNVIIYTSTISSSGALYAGATGATGCGVSSAQLTGTTGVSNKFTFSQRFMAIPVPTEIATQGYVNFTATGSGFTIPSYYGLIGRMSAPTPVPSTFTNLVNVDAYDNNIRKNLATSAWDSGAISNETFTNLGFVSFKLSDITSGFVGGISSTTNTTANFTDINYGICVQGGSGLIFLFENGTSVSSQGTASINDVFKVAIVYDTTLGRNAVKFYRNGVLLYTSTTTPVAGNYHFDSSIYGQNGEIRNVVVCSTNSSTVEATMLVVDYRNYNPPTATSGTYDFTLAVNNGDNGALYLFDGRVLLAGQSIRGGQFFPQASIGSAFIQRLAVDTAHIRDAAIQTAHINYIEAYKIVANQGDFQIILVDKIGSRNYVEQGSLNPQLESVEWEETSAIGVILDSSNTITKNIADSWSNSGASSDRQIHSGNGYLEFTIPNVHSGYVLGLNYGDYLNPSWDVDFGIYITRAADSMTTYILENGSIVSTLSAWAYGDTYRVAIEGTQVKYYRIRNSVTSLLYTSSQSVKYPLFVHGSMYYNGSLIVQPKIYGLLSNTVGIKPHWVNLIGVSFDASDDQYKISNTGWAYPDSAGAFSADYIPYDGAVETTVAETNTYRIIGLSYQDTDVTQYGQVPYDGINYGIYLKGGAESGQYDIRENPGTGQVTRITLTYATGDLFRIERTGTTIKYRKNGSVVYTSTTPSTGNLYIDTGIYDNGATLKKVRLYRAGAIAQGWQNTPDGLVKLGKGVKIGQYDVLEQQAQLFNAFTTEGRYRGNDVGSFMIHKISNIKITSSKPVEDGDVFFQLAITFPGYESDIYANSDSIRRARIRVYNKFGEQVADFPPFTFCGDGIVGQGYHTRKYADPLEEAIYKVDIDNIYTYSQPLFLKAGVKSLVMPTLLVKSSAPQDLNAIPVSNTKVNLSWTFSGNVDVYKRLRGDSVWASHATNIATMPYTVTGLAASTIYEFRIAPTGNAVNYSNIAYTKTLQQAISAETYPAPSNLTGSPNGSAPTTQINLSWVRNATTNTNVEIWRNGSLLTTKVAGTDVSYTATGLSANTSYTFKVRNKFSSTDFSEFSNEITVATQAVQSANAPSALTSTAVSSGRIDLRWTNNGAGGTLTIDRSLDASSWTTIASGISNTTTAYSNIGLTPNTTYYYRISNTGVTGYSNIAYDTTFDIVPPVCVTYNTFILVIRDNKIFTTRAINVNAGDIVVSIGENGERKEARVVNAFKGISDTLNIITTKAGKVLHCTPSHPLIRDMQLSTVASQALNRGDSLLMYNQKDEKAYIDVIECKETLYGEFAVITFQLDNEDHTFVSDEFVSHNIDQKEPNTQ